MTSFRFFIISVLSLIAFSLVLIPLLYHYHCADSGLPSPLAAYVIPLKGSLVPILAIFWILVSPVRHLSIYVVTVTSTIGDLLMISIDPQKVLIAGFLFGFTHIAFFIYWIPDIPKVPLSAYWAMVPNIAMIAFQVLPSPRQFTFMHAKFMFYSIWLLGAASASIARGYAHNWQHYSYVFAAFGYFAFCVSDAILLGEELKRGPGPRTSEMYIVLSYAVAQVCLYFSLVIDPKYRIERKE
jgi:hypothetical protein